MNNRYHTLAEARALDRQGRLNEAVEAYRQLLTAEPRNGDVLQLLGIALGRMGRPQEAIESLSAAAVLQPSNPVLQANLGNALNGIGRSSEALACYGRAVVLKPDFAAAHHGRGMTLLRLGQSEAALQALNNAARLLPGNAGLQNDLGVALERLHRMTEALTHFERGTQLDPDHVEAHHNRGLLEAALGRHAQALDSLDRALALRPDSAAIYTNRGNVLADLDRKREAIGSYGKALELDARDPVTLRKRGRLLMSLQQWPAALVDFTAATALATEDPDSHFQQGVALACLQRHPEALASFDRALALQPGSAEILNNRGVALVLLGRPEEAVADFVRALAVAPVSMEAYTNTANVLTVVQRHSEALQYFDRALSIKPQDASLKWGKARVLLSLGDFRQGWLLHESRLELEYLRPLQRHTQLRRWRRGESIDGKTLLVHAEQGLGDTVQFCRYLPVLEALGARVICEVQPALQILLRSLPTHAQIVAVDAPLPPFDLSTPLLSLPWLAGTLELESIPGGVPYLSAEAPRIAVWKERLAAFPGLKVGIAWQGNLETEKQGGFIGRSFGLAAMAPLAKIPGVTLISLQKGAGSEQRAQVDFASRVTELADPWDRGPRELMETAALMSGLDLIVTADTLTAHLAGALGLPVWVVLSASPDWRWLIQRQDSPWYPTMRLFRRQPTAGWSEVLERVANELAALCAQYPVSS